MTELTGPAADRNCLGYWFPLIRDAGLPVPETRIIKTDIWLSKLLDGQTPEGWECFLLELQGAGEELGYPFFLRTGHTSGKHHWERTCYVPAKDQIGQHVFNLVECSECADFMGLPYNVWAVRKMLPTNPMCVLPAYGNMPLCREFRCFVRDGEVLCVHPYWTWASVWQGFDYKGSDQLDSDDDLDYEEPFSRELPEGLEKAWQALCEITDPERKEVGGLAARAGKAVGGGYWSVDILETKRGLFVTDMALGEQSFHWPGCENAETD